MNIIRWGMAIAISIIIGFGAYCDDQDTFTRFTGGTPIRTSEVNGNFDRFLQNVYPRNAAGARTTSAYDLGSPTYKWNNVYAHVASFDAMTFVGTSGAFVQVVASEFITGETIQANQGLYGSYLSTGNGTTEVYLMNQPLQTTDTVTFAAVLAPHNIMTGKEGGDGTSFYHFGNAAHTELGYITSSWEVDALGGLKTSSYITAESINATVYEGIDSARHSFSNKLNTYVGGVNSIEIPATTSISDVQQKIFDLCSNDKGGGTLYLPSGYYQWNSGITIEYQTDKNIQIIGDGPTTIISLESKYNTAAIFLNGPIGGSLTIRNLKIITNSDGNVVTGALMKGIHSSQGSDEVLIVDNVDIVSKNNLDGWGIHSTSQKTTISNCRISVEAKVSSSNSHTIGIFFEGVKAQNKYGYRNIYGNSIFMSGDDKITGIYSSGVTYPYQRIKISDNSIFVSGNAVTGESSTGILTDVFTSNVLVSGNSVVVLAGIGGTGNAINLTSNTTEAIGNNFYKSQSYGIITGINTVDAHNMF